MQLTQPFQGLRFRYCVQRAFGFDPLEETMFRASGRAQYHASLDEETGRLSNIVDLSPQVFPVSCFAHSLVEVEMAGLPLV